MHARLWCHSINRESKGYYRTCLMTVCSCFMTRCSYFMTVSSSFMTVCSCLLDPLGSGFKEEETAVLPFTCRYHDTNMIPPRLTQSLSRSTQSLARAHSHDAGAHSQEARAHSHEAGAHSHEARAKYRRSLTKRSLSEPFRLEEN